MKKSNWITLSIAAVVSIVLLWLWYFLGFYLIDNPLDLVLSIVWWVLIALVVFMIFRVEKARKQRIRTMYVGKSNFFNSEAGTVAYADEEGLISLMGNTLEELKYDFTKNDLPDLEDNPVEYVVKTSSFDTKDEDDTEGSKKDIDEWEGEVLFASSNVKRSFGTKEELTSIIRQAHA